MQWEQDGVLFWVVNGHENKYLPCVTLVLIPAATDCTRNSRMLLLIGFCRYTTRTIFLFNVVDSRNMLNYSKQNVSGADNWHPIHHSSSGHRKRYGTGPQGHRARLGLGPVVVLNFLYPSNSVRTVPPVSVRIRVRIRASISLLYRLYAWCVNCEVRKCELRGGKLHGRVRGQLWLVGDPRVTSQFSISGV